ncbi:tyrosinase family protein [Gallaecimonas xiamenensis]|uniref:Tyrosinase n=1 Tax=Gallaecimonas xiamenensis 3-C-1 TaxID=745411 RepID=K2IQE7_9GAMM|nr:tyrosinase family protein [Gallaecimonas xiamenensis]EKE72416.1 tyrosinase [Gallaecimonas xiamenensis 3-C-1]
MAQLKVRYSVRELQDRYDRGDKKPLEDLVRAWHKICLLSPDDLNSFFVIGGYHGEPFAGQGATDPSYWGGYCNHGNVLFPTWHRVYMLRIEQALNAMVPGVAMAYWDETSDETLRLGIPKVLTSKTFPLDGQQIKNPLYSYVLQKQVNDAVQGDENRYTKPVGYETVRYPLSGLVGTAEAREETRAHNADFPDPVKNTELLNQNVLAWLKGKDVSPTDPNPSKFGIYWQFENCLSAPNYTAFSNTTSAAAWNKANKGLTTALEAPHNDVHLAVGGFDVPNQGQAGQIPGANGDMGENNTAGLDPIFFFHHCNVDRMFWLWQVQNGYTEHFDIIPGYAGTSSSNLPAGQGPAVGQHADEELTMDSHLYPFLKDPGDPHSFFSSRDCINIEKQLGVTYSPGSLVAKKLRFASLAEKSVKKLRVYGINRDLFSGSFVISAYAVIHGKRHFLGYQSILSRWNVKHCQNCQTHLGVEAFFDLSDLSEEEIKAADFQVEIQHRGSALPKALQYQTEVID